MAEPILVDQPKQVDPKVSFIGVPPRQLRPKATLIGAVARRLPIAGQCFRRGIAMKDDRERNVGLKVIWPCSEFAPVIIAILKLLS